jgi:DNA-binding MarR family transcriptional regulator
MRSDFYMGNNYSNKILEQIRSCTNLSYRLAHIEHRYFNHEFRNFIGRGQGLVLHILAKEDGLTQSEITEKLDIRPSSLGELVAKLEKSGYVERRQNENDKRVINVFITDKGRKAEKEFVNPRQKDAESWCLGLSEEDKAKLSELLEKLINSMENALSKKSDELQSDKFDTRCHEMNRNRGHFHGDNFDRMCGSGRREFHNGFRF